MNNYTSWYPSSQTTNHDTLIFPQPMQITTPLNHNYQTIAKDFIEKIAPTNTLDIISTGPYYSTNALISLHIHRDQNDTLFEITGHGDYINKLTDLGIQIIKYTNALYIAQPVGKNSILIIIHGKTDINGVQYATINIFVVRIVTDKPQIINQIFEIFM